MLSDLDAYYSLDDDGTDSDSSNDLTVTGAIFDSSDTASGSSHSASFDGTDDNLKIANRFEYNSNFSLSLWFKGESGMDDYARLIDNNYPDGGGSVRGYRLYKKPTDALTFDIWGTGGTGSYGVYIGGVSTTVGDPTLTFDGTTWHHVVCTYTTNNGPIKIYIDGTLAETDAVTQGTISYTNVEYFGIGARVNRVVGHGDPEHWKGLIDEVGVWSRTLTQAEVTDLYNDGDGMSYEEGTVTSGGGSPGDISGDPHWDQVSTYRRFNENLDDESELGGDLEVYGINRLSTDDKWAGTGSLEFHTNAYTGRSGLRLYGDSVNFSDNNLEII